ncbi:hypothetical protein [Burkholderia multivorans]|uniref:hypothetical protein n=1 Tax=Burkholderia multivorans TaxID=87883 RepID=UPI0009E0DED1|nr:hypothetical protein [Burkholderia multivorans]SAJ89337.1 lytic transglycosylase catalytic subunit [Burkholderia multivorans]
MSAFDDYLNAAPAVTKQSFDAYLASPSASTPVPPAPQQTLQAQQQAPFRSPGSFLMGVGDAIKGGVQSMAHGGAWIANKVAPDAQFTKDLNAALPQIDQTISAQDQQYQSQRQGSGGIDWMRLAGNAVGAAPLAISSPSAAGMGILGRTAVGAGMGAANALLTPATDPNQSFASQKLGQAAAGALIGGAAIPVASGIGNMVSGVTDPIRQRLAQAGVQMTPGQILGGALQRTEDKLTSVPVLGDFIKNGQQRAVQSFNRAAYNSALEPIGQSVPDNVGTGSAGVDYVRREIGKVYDSIAPRATFVADQNFNGDVAAIRANLAQNAPGSLNQFDNIVQNQVTDKLQHGFVLDGQQWGNTRSTISGIARNQRLGNATPDNRTLADALDELNNAINAGVARSSPPEVTQDLARANAAYSQYKQIERAAGMAGASNNGNIFTAAQYANAVRRGATASQKATNSGLNGQLASDASDVLGGKYPDSGTVGRSLLTLGLGAAAGHAAAPGVVIPAAVGIGVGSIPYTSYGQRLAQALLMNRPALAAPVGNAISQFGPRVGVLLAPSVARSPN